MITLFPRPAQQNSADMFLSPRQVLFLVLVVGLQLLFFCLPVYSVAAKDAGDERARKILAEVDDLWRSASSSATVTMQVKTRNYSRTVSMQSWSKGREMSLVRILSPKKEKGTATLKSGTSIYTYLPKTDRTIRLTSSMMMGSWMGSHFTNDDLVKESRLADDYDPRITFEGVRQGQRVIEFTLVPKADAPVVWGKIVTTVYADSHIPIHSEYYDEDMVEARSMEFSDIQRMDGRDVPMVLKVVPMDKPDEYTELVYEKITFDLPLKDNFFSLMQLRRK